MSFKKNYETVLSNIEKAKEKSPYHQDVTLVAVTKTYEAGIINAAIDQGITHIGENRVQEIQKKYPEVKNTGKVDWHLIGSLQTNKVKYIIDKVSLIHSLDRYDLAKEINKRALSIDKVQDCLIQVKISDEESKRGLAMEDCSHLIKSCLEDFSNIRIRGLMGMAPYFDDSEETRQYFSKLKELFDEIKDSHSAGDHFDTLSMGMSNDYTIAIEEGATMVRIGSALFSD